MTIRLFLILSIIIGFGLSSSLPSCSAAQLRRVRTEGGELGRGVQGAVYKVSDTEVVKVLEMPPGDPAVAEVEREISIMNTLKDYPLAAKFYDSCAVAVDGLKRYYIFMERCDSELLDYLDGVEQTPAKFYEILLHLTKIFYDINSKGVYHIDNQPGNVMMCGGQLKLIDFGRGILNRTNRNKRQNGFELMNMAGLFASIRKQMAIEAPELDPLLAKMKEQGLLCRGKAALTLTIGEVRDQISDLAFKANEGAAASATAPIRRFIAAVARDEKRSIFSKYSLLTKILMPQMLVKVSA